MQTDLCRVLQILPLQGSEIPNGPRSVEKTRGFSCSRRAFDWTAVADGSILISPDPLFFRSDFSAGVPQRNCMIQDLADFLC